VSIKVENGAYHGKTPELETQSRFEFKYFDYGPNECPCGITQTVLKTGKTKTVSNSVSYTSVEPPE
jgi:hypothetical protein